MNNVWLPAFTASGIDQYAYIPPHQPMKASDWPTLGDMIDGGKRLVVFMDAGADTAGDTVDFILPEFPNVSLSFALGRSDFCAEARASDGRILPNLSDADGSSPISRCGKRLSM